MNELDTDYHGSGHMFSPMVSGRPFLPRNNPENHVYPQRNRPTEQSLAPTHSCLIWSTGRSQLSFHRRMRNQAVSQHIRAQDSQGTDCLLGPPATNHFLQLGTLQGLQTGLVWLARLRYTHREGSPGKQRSLPRSLGPCWVVPPPELTQGNCREAQPGVGWGAQPGHHNNRCPLCAQLNIHHSSDGPGLF